MSARADTVDESFQALTPLFSEWALMTESTRWEKRATSSMATLRDFYGRVGPCMPQIAAHLDAFAMGSLPPREKQLLGLALMFMEVAIAVEFFAQPEVPRGFPRQRWLAADVRGQE